VFNAMAFDFSSTNISIVLSILLFILIRAAGKYTGMYIGTHRLKMDEKVKRYAFAGLIPQGGIRLQNIDYQRRFRESINLSQTK
jgi:hypothetical protein